MYLVRDITSHILTKYGGELEHDLIKHYDLDSLQKSNSRITDKKLIKYSMMTYAISSGSQENPTLLIISILYNL